MRRNWWDPISLLPTALYGAEGEEGEEDPEPQEGEDGDKEKSYSQEYVDQLRREAASRRVKANESEERVADLEKQLADIKKAEMDDIERLQTELEEARTELAEASDVANQSRSDLLNERVRNTVYREAVEQGFQDPEDALSMISQDGIVEDGNVKDSEVRKQLKKLAEKKPYLLKKSSGSGDGGAGREAPDPDTFKGKVDKYKDQFQKSGRVSA